MLYELNPGLSFHFTASTASTIQPTLSKLRNLGYSSVVNLPLLLFHYRPATSQPLHNSSPTLYYTWEQPNREERPTWQMYPCLLISLSLPLPDLHLQPCPLPIIFCTACVSKSALLQHHDHAQLDQDNTRQGHKKVGTQRGAHQSQELAGHALQRPCTCLFGDPLIPVHWHSKTPQGQAGPDLGSVFPLMGHILAWHVWDHTCLSSV
jgi:hypothetical protein